MSIRIINDGPVPVVVNIWETVTPASDGENVERIDLALGESTRPIEIRSWSRGVTVMEAIPAEGKPPPALSPRSNLSVAQAPPVDRSQQTLTDGSPETDDHRELRPDGMQKGYVVLSEEERAKGFVRPVRRTYIHFIVCGLWKDGGFGKQAFPKRQCGRSKNHVGSCGNWIEPESHHGCGVATTMGTALAETYARDPKFYSGTFCVGCRAHYPVGENGEFVWDDGTKVGT